LSIPEDPYYVIDADGNGEYRDSSGLLNYNKVTSTKKPIVSKIRIPYLQKLLREALDRKRRGENIYIKRRGATLTIESQSQQVGALEHRLWENRTRHAQLQTLKKQLQQKMRKVSQQSIVNQDQKRINQYQLEELYQMQDRFNTQMAQIDQQYQRLQKQSPGLQRRLRAQQQQDRQAQIDFQQQAQQADLIDAVRHTHQKRLAQEQFLQEMQAQMQSQEIQAFLRQVMGEDYLKYDREQEIARAFEDHMRPYEDMQRTDSYYDYPSS